MLSMNSPSRDSLGKRFLNGWDQFFFSKDVPYGMALTRIFLSLTLLIIVLTRWHVAREIYSLDGAPAPLPETYGKVNPLPLFSGTVTVALNSLLAFSLITSALGWFTRPSLIVTFILYNYFGLIDAVSTMTKYTVIASHGLLLLCLSECGAVWSLDARYKQRADSEPPKFYVWPQKLMFLVMGIVYIGAAVTKMHTPTYFSGDQLLYWMNTDYNGPHPIGHWLLEYPFLVVLFGYIAIIWEVMFVFLVWNRIGRQFMIWVGVIFHLMTFLTLGLFIFPLVMFSMYCSAITSEDLAWMKSTFRRFVPSNWNLSREPALIRKAAPVWPTTRRAVAFLGVGALFITTAVAAEHWLDRYGLRRPEGPYQLKELSHEHVKELFRFDEPIQDDDRLMSFRLGSVLIGGRLVFDKKEFRQQELITGEVSLNPPHDDMVLTCTIYDGDNKIVDRANNILARESFRWHFTFGIGSIHPPGEYTFVLRSADREMARKKVMILPMDEKVLAN